MRFSLAVGLASALSLATLASAATCVPTSSWCFGSNPEQVGNGTTYSITGDPGAGSIAVFGEQVNNSTNNIMSTPVEDNFTSTLSGLFSTNTSVVGQYGTGIAPFDPAEGGTPSNGYPNQLGINDDVTHNYPSSGSYGNILELELGSGIADGTTLSFLLQGPTNDPITGELTSVNVYSKDASGVTNPSSMTSLGNFGAGQISTTSSVAQFTITKDTTGTEFIAIEADCHYLLLDSITPGTSSVPEPRFYGLLLAGLLGLAGMAYQKRRAAQTNG